MGITIPIERLTEARRVSPRRGGEADKIGNTYERAWTVHNLLLVLSGEWDSIAIEKGDGTAEGAEFVLKRGTWTEVHQLKRQPGMQKKWSVVSLAAEGVWSAARKHAAAGRRFVFVSMVPSPAIQELAERARRVDSAGEFVAVQLSNADLRRALDDLCDPNVLDGPQRAWEVLRAFRFVVYDQEEIQRTNESFCNVLFEGTTGRLAAAALSTIAAEHLGVTHTAAALAQLVQEFGFGVATRTGGAGQSAAAQSLQRQWLASIGDELLDPPIPRREVRDAFEALDSSALTFVVGSAGAGKSAVTYELARAAIASNIPTLGFRLDRVSEYATTHELGAKLGLDSSPVAALGLSSGDSLSVLIVDQLDAVSLVSGRMPRGFDVVTELVREARAFPKMKIVLVCREFDLDNDERFRALLEREKATKVPVGPLSPDEVRQAVRLLGSSPDALTAAQLEMLRSPLNLTMFVRTRGDGEKPGWASPTDLFDAFWDRKRRDADMRKPGVRFAAVVEALARAISAEGRLAVHESIFDADELGGDALVLISEQVLVKDGRLVAFFHESFFDYSFARTWVNRGEALTDFLLTGDQELFVRGQVRQILSYLRGTDERRFLRELKAIVGSEHVRFHVKQNALTVLADLAAPNAADTDFLLELLADPWLSPRAAAALVRPSWVVALDTSGALAAWVASPGATQQEWATRAIHTLGSVDVERTLVHIDQLAGELLPSTLLHALDIDMMCTSIEFQQVVVSAVRRGEFGSSLPSIWYFLQRKVGIVPDFCTQVFRVYLTEQPRAWELNERGQVAIIDGYTDGLDDFVRELAATVPKEFLLFVVPYLVRVCELTSLAEVNGRVLDRHFAWRYRHGSGRDQIDEALLAQSIEAFRAVGHSSEPWLAELLDVMAASNFATIQMLLYEALKANPERYAGRARDLILEGGTRLMSGYADGAVWLSAELIRSIAPFLDDDDLHRLEDVVRDFRVPGEGRPHGHYAFSLLDAVPDGRRTSRGSRRFAEYQRIFGDRPHEPGGIEGGFIGSPISSDRASLMSDKHWLRAMSKHSKPDERNWRTFTGGASELSQVLKARTIAEPARFAALALQFEKDMNPAYGAAILLGLGEADRIADPTVVFQTVEHLAGFEVPEIDRWLGYAVRHYSEEVPISTFEWLVRRAVESPDPRGRGLRGRGKRSTEDIYSFGMNTVRGSLADDLADLVISDMGHERTDAAIPAVTALAIDPALPVRVLAARLVHAAMRDRPDVAVRSAQALLALDPRAIAFRTVVWMIMGLGHRKPDAVDGILSDVLRSEDADVRRSGGVLAGYAAAQWGIETHLQAVLHGVDDHARAGLAALCAGRYVNADADSSIRKALLTLADSDSEIVRKEVAHVVVEMRDQPLRQHAHFLLSLIESRTFPEVVSQFKITLERSLDRVDDLVCASVRRLVGDEHEALRDVRTARAADGHEFAGLIIRSLAQADLRSERIDLLDVLDDLLRVGAYGVETLIANAER